MSNLYSIQDVEYALEIPRHKINYAIQAHNACNPGIRFGNQRIFTDEDIEQLREHFSEKE